MPDSTFGLASSRAARWLLIAAGLLTFLHLFERSLNQRPVSLDITRSTFDWSTLHPHNPVDSIQALPPSAPQKLRRVQHIPSNPHNYDVSVEQARCKAVKAAANKTWKSFQQELTPQDQAPLNGGWQDPFGPWGAMLVDALDTLWIMGMKKEFNQAVQAIGRINWSVTHKKTIEIRETTTRYLGGLLSAYDLSKDEVLLIKAQELGDMLYMGFDTPNHMPPFWLDFEKAKNGQLEPEDNQPASSVTGLSLEFTRLSQLTGNDKYYDAVARITDRLVDWQNKTKVLGLWPSRFDLKEETYNHDNVFTLRSDSGSTYENLVKMHALLGGLDDRYEAMYHNASDMIIQKLLFRPMTPKKLDVVFPGTFRVGDKDQLDAEIRHEACFAGGMFGLAGRLFNYTEHMKLGARMTNGCMWAYNAFPHNIMPEAFKMVPCDLGGCKWEEARWRAEVEKDLRGREDLPMGFVSARDPSFSLRPEAIESIFTMYRITGHQEYREAAWKMFQAIENSTMTEHGNAWLADVTTTGQLQQRDPVGSHWLGATLKYFYLIFSSTDLVSLDDYVFNTESHPFLIPKG